MAEGKDGLAAFLQLPDHHGPDERNGDTRPEVQHLSQHRKRQNRLQHLSRMLDHELLDASHVGDGLGDLHDLGIAAEDPSQLSELRG